MLLINLLVITLIAVATAGPCDDLFFQGPPKVVRQMLRPSQPYGLCHANRSSSFLYTEYDITVLHSNWVAYRLDYKNMIRADGGRRSFIQDPQLTAANISQVSPNSPNNGYGSEWNKGHLAPSKAFSWDKAPNGAWEHAYMTTNIAPQAFKNNQQGWRILEANVFNWTVTHNASLFVFTGTYYQNKTINWIKGGLGVPDYFYKAICDGKQSVGFLSRNVLSSTGADAAKFWRIIDLQKFLGLDFGWDRCGNTYVNPGYWW